MDIFIGAALVLILILLYRRLKSKKAADDSARMAEEKRQQDEKESAERRVILEELAVYQSLRDSIQKDMSLDELILAFLEMCDMDVGEKDELLFETGTKDFAGVNLFHLDLVRKFEHADDHKDVLLRLSVVTAPNSHTEGLQTNHQGENGDGMFFSTVCTSKEYQLMKKMPFRAEVSVGDA